MQASCLPGCLEIQEQKTIGFHQYSTKKISIIRSHLSSSELTLSDSEDTIKMILCYALGFFEIQFSFEMEEPYSETLELD